MSKGRYTKENRVSINTDRPIRCELMGKQSRVTR